MNGLHLLKGKISLHCLHRQLFLYILAIFGSFCQQNNGFIMQWCLLHIDRIA
jgi:hypothetical protein